MTASWGRIIVHKNTSDELSIKKYQRYNIDEFVGITAIETMSRLKFSES
jgi:hypothetical protein